MLAPVPAEPAHVLDDRLNVLRVLLDRVGIVESEVADAPILGGDAEVEAYGRRVADVQVAVGLRRKPRRDAAAVLANRHVVPNDGANEICGLFGDDPALRGTR